MVSHSCHTNHDVVILVIRVTNVNFAIENFEENCPASKILVGFFSLTWRIYYKLSYEKFCKKAGRENVTKILKNAPKG